MITQATLSTLRAIRPYVYLASPYTKYPAGIHNAFAAVCAAAGWLIQRGVRLYCPIAHTHPVACHGNIDPLDHSVWLPADEAFMETAGGLAVLKMPTWDNSYGIQVEINRFVADGKTVLYLDWPLTEEA